MIERHQRLCVWAGIGFAPFFVLGFWVVAHFVPPPSPHMTADAVRNMFVAHHDRIRIGLWIATGAAPLLGFFVAALTHQIRRIAGQNTPLATAQVIIGSCLILEFIFPQLVWQTAAFRAERSAAIVQTLNDLAWLPYVGVVGTAMAQMVIIAVVIFQDKRAEPLLPRWAAYLNLWAALGVASGSLVIYTKTGPFAWNGLIAWYLLCVSFFTWMVTMTVLMIKASHRVEASEGDIERVAVPEFSLSR